MCSIYTLNRLLPLISHFVYLLIKKNKKQKPVLLFFFPSKALMNTNK